jgi:tRNA A-37 threonylcarbamoyl transferase component Bud32
MGLIGTEIAKMHLADIIHGDLTTSNMMLRHPSSLAALGLGLQTELVSSIPAGFSPMFIPLSGLD